MKSTLILARSGCLIPFLIIFNFIFGWLYLKPLVWLGVGIILIILFLLNSLILARKMVSLATPKRNNRIIDIEAEVMDNPDCQGKLK